MFTQILVWIGIVLILSGCDLPRSTQPSVLVVAVEGLGFESLSCEPDESSDRVYESLRPFCEEAVRFSHAYAPSTMSQSSMSSLLTGLYPLDHGVHNNGSDFLSARFNTVAESALQHGYRTLFVSGGAPIWRKSGLAQGFEVFDDTMDIAPGTYYRPSGDVAKIATNWIEHESASTPFLSFLYFNDLQFPQGTTRTREGELQERSTDGQIEEVAESLATLVRWLKAHKRWNSTHVVFLGLNSFSTRENDDEPLPLSLKSSSVQVSLFIKPAHKERDNVMQWAVDRSVSLVDVGRTLFDWVGSEPARASNPELEAESLVEAVTKSEPHWRADRVLLSESGWPDWIAGAGIRYAVRQNRFLYIDDKSPLIFNTLTDRMETLPLKRNDPLWTSYNGQVMEFLSNTAIRPWSGMKSNWSEQISVARELWRADSATRHITGKEAWGKWYLARALSRHDWREVKRLAEMRGEALGTYVAARNLNETPAPPNNPCLRLILNTHPNKNSDQNECEDENLLALHAWQSSHSEEDRVATQERFMHLYSFHLLDEQIGRLNFVNDLRWDVERELPEGPLAVDYVLNLKELEPFAKKVNSLLAGKYLAF